MAKQVKLVARTTIVFSNMAPAIPAGATFDADQADAEYLLGVGAATQPAAPELLPEPTPAGEKPASVTTTDGGPKVTVANG